MRFKGHVSIAFSTNTEFHCRLLCEALVRFGADAFEVTLLERCSLDDADAAEKKHIAVSETLAPA